MMNTSIPQKNMNTLDVGSTVPESNAADTSGSAKTVRDSNATIPATAFITSFKPIHSPIVSHC